MDRPQINIRVTREQAELLKRASKYADEPLTTGIRDRELKRARRILRQREKKIQTKG